MNELNVIKKDGKLLTDSRNVSEMIGQQHKDLLRTIRGYIGILTSANMHSLDFFIPNTYIDAKKEVRPSFLITKRGCDMVANKMTGEKGVLFTAAYVTEFEKMEKQINEPRQLSEKEQLVASMKLTIETSEELTSVKTKVDSLEERFDNELTLKHGESVALNHTIKKRIEQLFNNGITGTLETKREMYSKIYSQLRRAFHAPTYREVKRTDFDEAINWSRTWRPL